jgi:hypothetical protein
VLPRTPVSPACANCGLGQACGFFVEQVLKPNIA